LVLNTACNRYPDRRNILATVRVLITYLLARRGWTGRTTIDPNHTAAVEGDHYLAATTPAQLDAIEAIIEDGQADMLRKALPPVVLSLDAAATLAASHPDTVARLDLDDAAIALLVGGEPDVFTAACAKPTRQPLRPRRAAMPGQAMGLPAVSAGGVPTPPTPGRCSTTTPHGAARTDAPRGRAAADGGTQAA